MKSLGSALWHGIFNGAFERERASAPTPASLGLDGSFVQALYWFGFDVSSVVVHGGKT